MCKRWDSNPRLRRDHDLNVAPQTTRPHLRAGTFTFIQIPRDLFRFFLESIIKIICWGILEYPRYLRKYNSFQTKDSRFKIPIQRSQRSTAFGSLVDIEIKGQSSRTEVKSLLSVIYCIHPMASSDQLQMVTFTLLDRIACREKMSFI